MDFTNEQKNALEAKGRVLVSAAAGSGKTAVLVEKCVNLICDKENPVPVDRILVVTFTVAAAAEMRERILKSLNEKIKEKPDNTYLRKQKLLLPSAKIGTIDSLCISLAREYFYKLGISPDYKIADNSVINRLQSDTADEIINKYFENNDKVFLQLVSIFGDEKGPDELKENIYKFYDYLSSLSFPDEFCDKVMGIYENFDDNSVILDIAFEYYSNFLINKIAIFQQNYNDLQTSEVLFLKYGPAFEEVLAKLRRALDFIDNKDYDGIYNMLKNYTDAKLSRVYNFSDSQFKDKMQKAKNDTEQALKDLKKTFGNSKEKVFSDNEKIKPLVEKFLSVTKEFSEDLYQKKLQNNCFSFSDIECKILNLLVKKEAGKIVYTDTAKELSQKYFAVLVDEYQDTNDLQNTIFEALSNGGKNLFMVGDVKQSIYGFRNANPKNFLKFRDELPIYEKGSNESKVIMSGNFRSQADVCHFVNFLFYRLFSKKCGEMDYLDEDKLVPKAEFEDVKSPRVSLEIVEQCSPAFSSVEHQIYHIAKIIKNKVNGEPCITDRDTKKLRKAEYKDFCILLRGRSNFQKYESIFKSLSIPVWIDDNEGLLDQPEIINIFSALQVIENPFSDIPLITLMLSDIYGFSADEVAKIRAENKNTEFYRALLGFKEKSEKMIGFLNEIEEFRRLSINCSVSALINKILVKTGYENTVFSYENGEEAYNNLILFKSIARNFEQNNSTGLTAFVNYINYQKKHNGSFNKSASVGENDNVVKVMTIHRSKGLQFPVCIVAELEKKFNTDDIKANLIMSEKVGIGIKYIDQIRKIKVSTFSKNIANLEKKALLISEELRVLYVALTRAKDFLYMVGCTKNAEQSLISTSQKLSWDSHGRFNPYFVQNCNNYLEMIVAGVLCHQNGSDLRTICNSEFEVFPSEGFLSAKVISDVDFGVEEKEVQPSENKFDEQFYEKIKESLEFSYKYKDLNKIFVKQSASALAHKEFSADYNYSNEPVFLRNQRLSAADKGTAMHKFMQFCDFESAKKDISYEIDRIVEQGKLTLDEAKSLKIDSLKAFINSSLCEKIIKSDSVYKEQGFMVEIPANEIYDDLDEQFDGENVIIQGYADLCFNDGKGIFIVDYKTDRADEKELIKRYKKQLDIYEKALKLTFNKKITGKAIYSFYLNKIIML